jgi:HEAT repeat protein
MTDYSRKLFASILILLSGLLFVVAVKKAIAEDLDELVTSLRSDDLKMQLSAVEELGRLRESGAIDALLNFVFTKEENWRVKIRGIGVLGDIADRRVSDRLVTLLNDPFLNEDCPAMKWHTAMALGKDFNKGSRAVSALIEALDYGNLLIKEAAIQSLGKIGDPRAVPFLIPALGDKNFAIRFSAIKALENIGDKQAVTFLRQITDNESDKQIKDAAVSALNNFKRN